MVPLALGSDTGGSVRLPASWCGVVGLKPTWGTLSRSGLVAFGSSLDQVGPIATTVRGAAMLFDAVAGHDPRDATSRPAAVPRCVKAVDDADLLGLRVGVVPALMGAGVDAAVRARVEEAIAVCARHGAAIVEVELPHARWGIAAYYVLSSAEAASNLARFDGIRYGRRAASPKDVDDLYIRSRTEGLGEEVRRRILLGTFALAAGYHDQYYARAAKARALIARDFTNAFAKADVLVTPVTPGSPFRFGERSEDPLAMYLTDAMTVPASLAGIPAISVPCGEDAQGLPVGLQIQAPALGEAVLFRAAAGFERAFGAASPPAKGRAS
jgi:aspartyl-tRNA(Asn)/glutamyl-tRNA(Gln) amidotransferase subunit A